MSIETVATIIERIESCSFHCEAGPLEMSRDWEALKAMVSNFYIVVRRGHMPQHTSGYGGWRFVLHTNQAEAEATADRWNRENPWGVPFEVAPFSQAFVASVPEGNQREIDRLTAEIAERQQKLAAINAIAKAEGK